MRVLKAYDWAVVLNFDRDVETFPFLKNLETFVSVCDKVVAERFSFSSLCNSVEILLSVCLSRCFNLY